MASKKRKKSNKSVKKEKTAIEDLSMEVAKLVLRQGGNSSEAELRVAEYRKQHNLSLNQFSITKVVAGARKQLESEFGTAKSHLISKHVDKYNQEIKDFLDIPNPLERQNECEEGITQDVKGNEEIARQRMRLLSSYECALQSIRAKELFLQVGSKVFQSAINDVGHPNTEEDQGHNFSKLTFEQKKDFLELLQECENTKLQSLPTRIKSKN